MDLLTTYTHDSGFQAITAPRLNSAIHKPPQYPLSLFQAVVSSPAVPWQRLLTVEILQLHALSFYLHSLPYRTQLKSKSKLLYDLRFTANQFVLASSPLRPTTSDFSFQLNPCSHGPYVTSSLMRRLVCLLWICLAFRQDSAEQLYSLLITSGYGPTENTVHCRMLTISAGMCSRHPATGCATPFTMNPLSQQRASFRDRYPTTGLHAIICFSCYCNNKRLFS
jgi:hypothetical protein